MEFSRKPEAFYFRNRHQAKNLGKKSLWAYVYTTSTNGVKFLINIVSVAILARLLMPEDFGYVAMAVAFVGTFKRVIGQALSMGVIQSDSLNHGQLSGFFWISMGLTLVVVVFSILLSPLVAWFFNEPLLTGIVLTMTLTILFTGLSASHNALLIRNMQFGAVSAIDLTARICSKIVAVTLAFTGAGYWALVFMPVSYEGLKAFFTCLVCTFRPKIHKINSQSGALLKLGSVVSVTTFISGFVRELDRIIIGKFLKSHALGLYSRSYNLGELPGKFIAWPLSRIAVSALSRLQKNQEKYKTFFLTMTRGYYLIIIPVLISFYLSCNDIILLVLGDKWTESIPIFKYLVLFFLLKSLERPLNWFMTSTYRSGTRLNKILILSFFNNILMAAGVFAGAPWGTQGIAMGLTGSYLVFFLFSLFFVFHGTFISKRIYCTMLWKIITSAVITIFAGRIFLIQTGFDMAFHFGSIIITFFFSILVYYLSFLALPGGKREFMDIIITIKSLLKKV